MQFSRTIRFMARRCAAWVSAWACFELCAHPRRAVFDEPSAG
jgi:hypothetical protein